MPQICPKCGIDFHTPSKLAQHLNRKIPCNSGKYPCRQCPKKFSTWGARHRHEKEACKGPAVSIEDLQEQNASLQQELADKDEAHQQHLAMVNQASAAVVQQIINNNTTNNNLVINIENLHVHNSVGKESVSHLKNLTLSQLGLQLKQDPSTFAKWCQILRADDEHPENHNVLLVDMDAKHAAMCDDGKWKMQKREDALLQLVGTDATSLYNMLARFGDEAREFRFEYLLHDIMAKAASLDKTALKPVMTALAEPLVTMTQRLYAQAGETSIGNHKSKALEQMKEEMREHVQKAKELEAKFAAAVLLENPEHV